MVEVTKFNFQEMLPKIEKSINSANFVAIDTEFTGLDLGSKNTGSIFDTVEDRYRKLRERASSFVPCQIGLSTYRRSENDNRYLVETFVFYIRPYMCGSIDKKFMCQASSIDFLCKYDFDFNKFFHEGIPYMNKEEEIQVLKEIEDGTISYSHEKLMELKPKRDRDMSINSKFTRMSQSSLVKEEQSCSNPADNRILFPIDKICHEYFQLIELRRKYPSLWASCEGDSIVVEIVTPEQKKKLLKCKADEEKRLLHFYLGFTNVFRMLKDAKKPIVGHNVLMDLMLFFQNFHQPLPSMYKEFKKELHDLFPVIFDTRFMWLNIKRFSNLKDIPKRSGLFDLYEMFKSPTDNLATLFSPDIQHVNCDKYVQEDFPHESGYDSFVTGTVFLRICHLIAMKKITNSVFIQPQTFKQHLNAVSLLMNKLNVGRLRVRHINLEGDDPQPLVSELLNISSRTSSPLNHRQLSELFDKYPLVEFKLSGNKKTAIIAVGNTFSYRDILRDFENHPDFMVTKYNVLKHSSLIKTSMWLIAIGCGCLVTFVVTKFLTQ